MVDLFGPTPEEMKSGETYRVVQSGSRMDLEKSEAVVIHLPKKTLYIFRIYATILEDTLENVLAHKIDELAEGLRDGYILGEEVKANYAELFMDKEPDKAPA